MNIKAGACNNTCICFFMKENIENKSWLTESYVLGVVALVFLIIGYQIALFIQHAAVTKIAAVRDLPDTVFVYVERESRQPVSQRVAKAQHSPKVQTVRSNLPRPVESFKFNPNTVAVEDLCRLGFTQKQAQSIDAYRQKGGRFRRKSDFAKSFVVHDSVYRRLEPYIDIPLLDLNLADSAAFDALPGIGGWFASKMVEYRESLGGYSYPEQLLDIYHFDQDKFNALKDLITVSPEHLIPYPLWTLPEDSLCLHPYIRNYETARAIVLFRQTVPSARWSVEALSDAGIISSEAAEKLARCAILK